MREQDRQRTAYHEVGHAIAAYYTEANPPALISIAPRGKTLGVMVKDLDDDQVAMTGGQAMGELMVELPEVLPRRSCTNVKA